MKQLTWEQSNLLTKAGVLPEDIAALQRLDLVEVYIERLDILALAKHDLRDIVRRYMDLRDQYDKVSDELEECILDFNNAIGKSIIRFEPNAPHPLIVRSTK